MTQFDDREKAYESKFAHDQELRFKALARRNKLLGLWAAKLMGMKGDAATAYALEVVKSDFVEAGEEDVYRKIKADFDEKGLDISEHRIRKAMAELMEDAARQVADEAKP